MSNFNSKNFDSLSGPVVKIMKWLCIIFGFFAFANLCCAIFDFQGYRRQHLIAAAIFFSPIAILFMVSWISCIILCIKSSIELKKEAIKNLGRDDYTPDELAKEKKRIMRERRKQFYANNDSNSTSDSSPKPQ